MAPSLSHSLLLQSRWQLDRKRNRKGLKDLLLLSFALKKNGPLIISHNAPRTEASVICGYEKAQESDRQPPQPWGEEVKKKKQRKVFFFFYKPTSRGLVALLLWEASGFIYPSQASLRTPVPSQVAGSERAPEWLLIVVVKERSSSLLTSLSGPSQSSHAPFPLLCQAPSPSQMPWSMVSVALHVNWKILNRFIQKLQWRQPALRFRGISRQRVKSVKLQINVSECVRAWTCLTCLWSQDLPNEASRHTLYLKRVCKESTPITQDRRWNDWEVQSALLFDI